MTICLCHCRSDRPSIFLSGAGEEKLFILSPKPKTTGWSYIKSSVRILQNVKRDFRKLNIFNLRCELLCLFFKTQLFRNSSLFLETQHF